MFGREINEHKKIPSIRYNNLTKDECDALYNLKNDSSIIIKGDEKSYVVVVQDREDYLKEAYKPLDDREVYEEDPNDPNVLINTIMKAFIKICLCGDLSMTLPIVSLLKILDLLGSIFFQKFVNAYMMFRVDQLFQSAAFTVKKYLYSWTTIFNHLL